MGVVDKFLNFMKMNNEDIDDEDEGYYDDAYDDEDDDFEDEEPAPVKRQLLQKSRSTRQESESVEEESAPKRSAFGSKITPINKAGSARKGGNDMKVCVIKPTSVDETREITETLLSNRTVVLNLESVDVDVAQRIIDFTSGSCFAIQGNLQKISDYIFLVTPPSVDISGDFQDLLGGAFNLPLG